MNRRSSSAADAQPDEVQEEELKPSSVSSGAAMTRVTTAGAQDPLAASTRAASQASLAGASLTGS